jgi:hypothetical protein
VATTAGLLLACGSSGPPPPWRAGHPDPSSLGLLDLAQAGTCATAAPDPDEAPAAISFQGSTYVQSEKTAPLGVEPGVEIDHTGNWDFYLNNNGSLTMSTPQADFLYVTGKC